MTWLVLVFAGLLETFWAIFLKKSEGFTRLPESVLTIVGMIASFYALAWSIRRLPIGVGYAVWTGIGIVGTCLCSCWLEHEPMHWKQVGCIILILIGIVGLKLCGTEHGA